MDLWRRMLVLVLAMIACLICVHAIHAHSRQWLSVLQNFSEIANTNTETLSELQKAVVEHALVSGDRTLLANTKQLATNASLPYIPLFRLQGVGSVSAIAQIVICFLIGAALTLTAIAYFRRNEPLSRVSVNTFVATTVTLLALCLLICVAFLPFLNVF